MKLLVYNTATDAFTIKLFSGSNLYGCGLEPSTGRFLAWGYKVPDAYYTKFMIQSFSAHPDFQTAATWSMSLLSSGTEDITQDNGQTIGATTFQIVGVPSPMFSNMTIVHIPGTSSTSDINYSTDDLIISVLEGSSFTTIPDLPCSISGATSIVLSTSNYLTTTVPSWVIFNSASGELTFTAPNVSIDTQFYLYINSAISGIAGPIQKLIKLTVLNCSPSNCQKCMNPSNTICEICSPGYNLISGACISPQSSSSPSPTPSLNSTSVSDTAKALSTTTTSTVALITGITILTSLMNLSSMASLWMTINQLQFYFLFLLTRAYIPDDVQEVIKGSDYASNIYDYIPLKRSNLYTSILGNFKFELSNSLLDPLEISNDSTVANTGTFFICLAIIIIFYACVCLMKFLFSIYCGDQIHCCFLKVFNWILEKIYKVMTFGYFIRNTLEISQFVLISSINEINVHNTKDSYRLSSFIFAIAMIFIFILMICLILYLTFSSYRLIEKEHNKLEEFFIGQKYDRKSKFYTTALLLRRIMFICLLIVFSSLSSKLLISILMLLQLFYVGNLIFIRPYKGVKENIIEILNELYISFLLSILILLNSENNWNSIKTKIYMWVLVSNTLVVFLIVLIGTIIGCIRRRQEKLQKPSKNEENVNQIVPKTISTNNQIEILQQRNNFEFQNQNHNQNHNQSIFSENRSIHSVNQISEDNRFYLPRSQFEYLNIKPRDRYLRDA